MLKEEYSNVTGKRATQVPVRAQTRYRAQGRAAKKTHISSTP